MTEMEPWLKRHLVEKGVMDAKGLTAKAKPRRCQRCKMPCIGGMPRAMSPGVYCDPMQLSAHGELQAALAGRRCFELMPQYVSEGGDLRGDLELVIRAMYGDSNVKTRVPREDNRIAVLVEHNCRLLTPMSWAIHRPPATDGIKAKEPRTAANWPGIPSLENWIEFGF